MEQVFQSKEYCCGCTACYAICPTEAITMMPDSEGFLYPNINEDSCIDCHDCRDVCPFIVDGAYRSTVIPDFYAAKHKSTDVLNHSSSGGAFTAFSDTILKENGVVYGADYSDEFYIYHAKAESTKERNRMRISKYAQSDLGDTFEEIQELLKLNKTVLFTGTPCQCAGLSGFIGTSDLAKNLYTCDVICYGIPSPLIWKDYKNLLEEESGGKLKEVSFRSKTVDWTRENSNRGFRYSIVGQDELFSDNRFFSLFFEEKTIMRPSCPNCKYTDIHRSTDITIADYWGIEKYSNDFYDPKGVSLIMINSPKGKLLFNETKADMIYEKRSHQESLTEQQRLRESVVFPKNRSRFWNNYSENGLKFSR